MSYKYERLRKNTEFKKVINTGRTYANKYFILFVVEGRKYENRFGITTARSIGSNAKRNLLKRRTKEIIRATAEKIKTGFDFVIIVKINAKDAEFKQLNAKLNDLFKRANILI